MPGYAAFAEWLTAKVAETRSGIEFDHTKLIGKPSKHLNLGGLSECAQIGPRLAEELQHARAVAAAIQLEGKVVVKGNAPALLNPGAFLLSLGAALEKTAATAGKDTRASVTESLPPTKARGAGKQTKRFQECDDTKKQPSKPEAEDAGKACVTVTAIPIAVPCSTDVSQLGEISAREAIADFPKAEGDEIQCDARHGSGEHVVHESEPPSVALTTPITPVQSGRNQPADHAQKQTAPLVHAGDTLVAPTSGPSAVATERTERAGDQSRRDVVAPSPAAQTPVTAGAFSIIGAVPKSWRGSVISVEVATGAVDSKSEQATEFHSSEMPSLHHDARTQFAEIAPIFERVGARQRAVTAVASADKVESRGEEHAASGAPLAPSGTGVLGKSAVERSPVNNLSGVHAPAALVSEKVSAVRNIENAPDTTDSKVHAGEPMQSANSARPAQNKNVVGAQAVARSGVPDEESCGNETTAGPKGREASGGNVKGVANPDSVKGPKAEVLVRVASPVADLTSHVARASDGRVQASVDRSDNTDRSGKTESENRPTSSKTAAKPTGPSQSDRQVHGSDLGFNQQQTTTHRNSEETLPKDLDLPHQSGAAQPTGAAANPIADKQNPVLESGRGELPQSHNGSVYPANSFVHTARILEQATHSEMRIALRTPETGNLEVRTFIRDGQAGAVIAVEKGDVRTALLTELPSLQANLKDRHLEVSQLAVTDYGGAYGSTGSPASGDGGQRQPARNANSVLVATAPNRQRDLDETQQNIRQSGLSVHA